MSKPLTLRQQSLMRNFHEVKGMMINASPELRELLHSAMHQMVIDIKNERPIKGKKS